MTPKILYSSVFLLCLFFPSEGSPLAREAKKQPTPFLLSLSMISELASAAERGENIAVVLFKTDWSQADQPLLDRKIMVSETGLFMVANEKWEIHHLIRVKGVFSVSKEFQGAFPFSGKMYETIRVRSEKDRLVYQLKPAFESQEKDGRLLIATSAKAPKKIAQVSFFGPLDRQDIENLSEVVKQFSEAAPADVKQETAESYLEASNPWKVYYGLWLLQEKKKLASSHFARAAGALPDHNLSMLLYEMLDARQGLQKKKELTTELCTFFHDAKPERQKRLLQILYDEYLVTRYHAYRNEIDLPVIQEAAISYRKQIASASDRKGVVVELDRIIAFRPKQQ